MRQDVFNEWVEALESGEYPQTRECLRNEEGYCCLGVLSDIGISHHKVPVEWWRMQDGVYEVKKLSGSDEGHLDLPESVALWANMHIGPKVYVDDISKEVWSALAREASATAIEEWCWCGFAALSSMNDNGVSFKTIAAVLRSVGAEKVQ